MKFLKFKNVFKEKKSIIIINIMLTTYIYKEFGLCRKWSE